MEIKEYRRKHRKMLKDFIMSLDQQTMNFLTNVDQKTLFLSYLRIQSILIVGLENNKIISIGSLVMKSPHTFEIMGVVTSQLERKKGHATRIVSYLMGLARGLGANKITLGVYKNNKKAIKFYEDLGFVRFKTEDGGYKYQVKF